MITVETQSDLGSSSLQSITRNFNIFPVADTPVVLAQSARGQLGEVIPLQLSSSLIDIDGSEQLRVEIRGLPGGMTLTDGTLTRIVTDSNQWIDITHWDLAQIVLQTAGGLSGNYALELRATATEAANQNFARTSSSFDLIVDEVMPMSEPDDNHKPAPLSSRAEDEPIPKDDGLPIQTEHHRGPPHFHCVIEAPSPLSPETTSRFINEFENESFIRSDSPSSALIPAPSFSRPNFELVDAHIFDSTSKAPTSSNSPEESEQTHGIYRIEVVSEKLLTSTEKLTMLGGLNHTLLLAWTMIRSSVSSFFGQNEASNADERRNTTPTLVKDNRIVDENLPES